MKRRPLLALALVAGQTLSGCGQLAPSRNVDGSVQGSSSKRAPSPAQQTRAAAWQDEIVYFALLDRFANGDPSNDRQVTRANPTAFHGGDLAGLTRKLDYLQDLGVTSLWVSPFLEQDRDQLAQTGLWGYHGYWTHDFTKVDTRFGTLQQARELVQQAHARGIKVLMDVVCNHAGYSFPTSDQRFRGWFHTHGNIQNWEDPWWLENGSMFGLPDFDQSNPAVANYLVDTYQQWARDVGFDAFRVDAIKHVPKNFWVQFNRSAHQKLGDKFITVGEVLNGDPGTCADYQNSAEFDSVFDFPLYYSFIEVFARGQSMRRLAERFAQDGAYRNAQMLSPFLDNHDVPRFLSLAGGDLGKLKLALACLLTIRGFPTIYYGTETGLQGGAEPDNRRDMNWGDNPGVTRLVKQLIGIRKGSSALSHGRQLEMWQDDQIYAFMRQAPDSEAFVFLNNAWNTQTRQVPLRSESRAAEGSTWVDALSGETFTVKNRALLIDVASKHARILIPSSPRRKG